MFELRILAGVLVPGFNKAPNNQLGDGVDGPEKPFLAGFPYLRSPSNGYTHSHDSPPQILHPAATNSAAE